MAKYFTYKKDIETSDGTKEVYVVRPSLLTMIVGEMFGSEDYFPRASFDTLNELEGYIENQITMNFTGKIVRNRLSFPTIATNWGFYNGKFEVRHRTPIAKLEKFSRAD